MVRLSRNDLRPVGFPAVWLIADRGFADYGRIDEVLRALAPALGDHPGRVAVIERDHTGTPDRVRFERLQRLRDLLVPLGVPLWTNHRADLALAAGADGVQLTGFGLPMAHLARHFPDLPRAASCHDLTEAAAAFAAGAAFVLVAPFADPTSKPSSRPPLGSGGLMPFITRLPGPIVALGGIDPVTAGEAFAAGAAGVATLGGVFGAADPRAALLALLAVAPSET